MRLVSVTLQGGLVIAVNPHSVSHLQPIEGRPGCMLFMDGDNLPTNLTDDFVNLQADINEALEDEATAIHNGDAEKINLLEKLIAELRRAELVGCVLAAIFFVLILISIFHK